ncbi:MAG: DUF302 domain-containing protein [Phycisphaeraceae bacterium]|nr:DUF302 domain-containing protein [Phycisphaeraceae bacterium]
MIRYGFTKVFNADFNTTLEAVQSQLSNQGFGVLTSIDLQAKLKEELETDISKYTILGACNPKMAYKAIQAEECIGLLLPCNVVVIEKEGKTAVSAVRPSVAMQMIDNPKLHSVAVSVEQSLYKVLKSIQLSEE